MDNRYEIAEQNGMSKEFADWFFDNKKDGCVNVWFMIMAAMWEGWQGRTATLQGADGNSPVITDSWVACSERMPDEGQEVIVMDTDCGKVQSGMLYKNGCFVDFNEEYYEVKNPSHWMPLPAAPQQEVK